MSFNYILYSRKSSEAKEKQALSIQDQNSECIELATREQLSVTYKLEESKSAFKPKNRPQFDLMIKYLTEGKANGILTWKPDRLCRNPAEGGMLLQLLQDGILEEIRTATGEVYTPDSDHLILQIHFGMANQYSRVLSQNVRRGLKHKVERGEYPNPAPIGYKGKGLPGQRNIEPHLVDGPLIKKAFELACTGQHSLTTISNFLYQEGLLTKQEKRIPNNYLHTILHNPVYYGYFNYNNELHKGNFEPIITKTLFDEAQRGLMDRSKPKKNTWAHYYNGLFKCAECSCAITTTVKQKYYKGTDRNAIYIYHHCTKRKGKCGQAYISGKELDKQILEAVGSIYIDEEVWKLGIELLKAKHAEESKRGVVQLENWQKQFKSNQNSLHNLIQMRAREEITKEEFMISKSMLMENRAVIEGHLSDNKNSSDNWLELTENFLNTCFSAKEIMEGEDMKMKRDLILTVGQNLKLKDGNLEFTFKNPFDVMLQPSYSSNWLGYKDSNPNYWDQNPASYH